MPENKQFKLHVFKQVTFIWSIKEFIGVKKKGRVGGETVTIANRAFPNCFRSFLKAFSDIYIQHLHLHLFFSLQSVLEPQLLAASLQRVLQEAVYNFENWTRCRPISETLAQPEINGEIKHVDERERSVDETSLSHSPQA